MRTCPLPSLMDEHACDDDRLQVLPPQGWPCPQGHPLALAHGAPARQRAPRLDDRGTTCGAVFTLLTGTRWRQTRSSGAPMVVMVRGVAPGVPTAPRAGAWGLDRAHVWAPRPERPPLIAPRVPPEPPARRGAGGR